MELFHASSQKYTVGQTYTAPNPIGSHCRSVEKGEGWINEILDQQRPEDRPSRVSSFYACNSLVNCQAYMTNEKRNESSIYYKVEMDCNTGFPMVLIDKIRKLGQGSDLLEKCISEYWSPTNEWNFLEFLHSSMTIMEEVLPILKPIMVSKSMMNYGDDLDLSNRLFSLK